jgi:hypothetical protein
LKPGLFSRRTQGAYSPYISDCNFDAADEHQFCTSAVANTHSNRSTSPRQIARPVQSNDANFVQPRKSQLAIEPQRRHEELRKSLFRGRIDLLRPLSAAVFKYLRDGISSVLGRQHDVSQRHASDGSTDQSVYAFMAIACWEGRNQRSLMYISRWRHGVSIRAVGGQSSYKARR